MFLYSLGESQAGDALFCPSRLVLEKRVMSVHRFLPRIVHLDSFTRLRVDSMKTLAYRARRMSATNQIVSPKSSTFAMTVTVSAGSILRVRVIAAWVQRPDGVKRHSDSLRVNR